MTPYESKNVTAQDAIYEIWLCLTECFYSGFIHFAFGSNLVKMSKAFVSLHLCLDTTPSWCVFEKFFYIAINGPGLYTKPIHNIFPVLKWVINFKIILSWKIKQKNLMYVEEAIIALPTKITLNIMKCPSDSPCCKPICSAALII